MRNFEVFLVALFICVAFLNVMARRTGTPYPIALVVGGLALAAIPGMPDIDLDPDLVLLIFLPPLLYSAAFFADLRALRQNLRGITIMATGLVLATASLVAVAGHAVIGLSWPMAFALGAIVSPTDPIAATSIMRRVGAPRRLVNVIEGESLVNDATALVIYRVAVAAAVGGTFSLSQAALELLGAAAGGIAIGLAVAHVIAEIRVRLEDTTTELTISLLTGYAAFIPADELGLSGVLAAVAAGLYLGWRGPELASPQTRLEAFAVWNILVFLLNATLFLLIGLQLPRVLDALQGTSAGRLAAYAALVCAVVIGARLAWVLTTPYIIRALDRRPAQLARRAPARERLVAGWSGMRGAVSLAAALALPLQTEAGQPLPERDLILFITFVVIVVTIVGQGLTLPMVIRRLRVREDGAAEAAEEARARLIASSAALERLDEVASEGWVRDDTVERLRGLYEFRQRRIKVRAGKVEDEDGIEERSVAYQRLLHVLFAAQRHAVISLRNEGAISNEVMHRIERELDLEEARLEI